MFQLLQKMRSNLVIIDELSAHDDSVVEGVHDAFNGVHGRGVGLGGESFNLTSKEKKIPNC